MLRHAIAARRELGVALRGGEAGAYCLNLSHQIDKVSDRCFILFQPHRIGQGQGQTESELGPRQPTAEVVPAQPARNGLGLGVDGEDPLPRDKHVVEPHLAVEFVIAAGQRQGERIAVARRGPAAQNSDAGRVDWNDKPGGMTVDFEPRQGADIDILGISRACVHTEAASHDHALAVLAHPLDRDPFPGIGPEALTDDRRAAAKGQEPAGAGDPVAVGHRVGDVSRTGVTGLRGGQDSQCDQMTV